MDCLQGYIGLREVTTPVDGMWFVNDLTGISTEMVGKIGNSELETAVEMWASAESLAIKELSNEIYEMLRADYACFPISSVNTEETYLDTIDAYICDNKQIVRMALWHLLGSHILNQAINTNKANVFSLVNKEGKREMRDQYKAKYERYMKGVLKQIPLKTLFYGQSGASAAYSYGWTR